MAKQSKNEALKELEEALKNQGNGTVFTVSGLTKKNNNKLAGRLFKEASDSGRIAGVAPLATPLDEDNFHGISSNCYKKNNSLSASIQLQFIADYMGTPKNLTDIKKDIYKCLCNRTGLIIETKPRERRLLDIGFDEYGDEIDIKAVIDINYSIRSNNIDDHVCRTDPFYIKDTDEVVCYKGRFPNATL